jgi:pimeloyl-ACP methyl ester carboxylesterase
MKQKIIALLFKYIPILAKKLWPGFRDSLIGNKTPKIIDFRNEPEHNNVILFLHGFSGESATTFGNIPQYIKEENRMNGWDMFAVGYSTNHMPSLGVGIWAAIPDITKLADFLDTTIRNQFARYQQIAIVAHSMGGLVVQKAILELDKAYTDKIKFVLLFGTPSNGLVKAGIVKFWNRQLRDMASDGKFITTLRQQWNDSFNNTYPFVFKAVAGTDDEFVPIASSQQPFDKKYCEVVSGNHLAIVKPDDKNHAGYQLIIATLTKTIFDNPFTDKEAINLLQGDYAAVATKLLPQKDLLDKKGLAKLIFALEGLGRSDEAIKILQDSSLAANNTDMLGIIGGRYKRKYLTTYQVADAEKSLEYYTKALTMATEKNDQEQMYYHAINLAFLSLVYKEDKEAMKNYATIALQAANNCPGNDYWKTATIAEANIYLEDIEAAKMGYIKAALPAKPREKLSMYANAFMGYTSLRRSDKEDDFIKLLKEQLLQ